MSSQGQLYKLDSESSFHHSHVFPPTEEVEESCTKNPGGVIQGVENFTRHQDKECWDWETHTHGRLFHSPAGTRRH